MSPEQLRGQPVDARSDIFALGSVLYEMLSGKAVFLRDTAAETSAAILREEPEQVSSTGKILPAEFERSIRRCLEKSPDARFQSASDLAYNLRSISTDQVDALPPPQRKTRTTMLVVVAAIVLGLTALAALLGPRLLNRPGSVEVTQGIRSIAVLPLQNLSGDPDQEYFVDGMHDALISELAKIDALAVISRQSVLQYQGTDKTIPEIAGELGVGGVVEGSVFRANGVVRITAQLVGAIPTERHLWAESYERELQDVLSLQREVAQTIAKQVNVTLTSAEEVRFDSGRQVEPEAYDYYLRGNQYFNRGLGGPDILFAVEMYELAVGKDSTFALAYAALAKAQARMVFQNYDDPADDFAGRSLSNAERALSLDPDLPEARAALGWYYYWVCRDLHKALEEFKIAFKSQPHNSDLLLAIGLAKRRLGKWDSALADLLSAFELDPISNEKATEVGISYFYSRQYEDSAEYFERAIRIAPDHHRAYMELAHTYLALDYSTDRARQVLREGASVVGREEFAKRAIGRNHAVDVIWLAVDEFAENFLSISSGEFGALEATYLNDMAEFFARHGRSEQQRVSADLALSVLESQESPYIMELARAYAFLGHEQKAIQAAEEAIKHRPVSDDARGNPIVLWNAIRVFAILGENDRAIDLLEDLFSKPSETSLGALATDPIWDPLRDDPRFQALLEEYDTN
jgi:serine/threonine-protein kinase